MYKQEERKNSWKTETETENVLLLKLFFLQKYAAQLLSFP